MCQTCGILFDALREGATLEGHLLSVPPGAPAPAEDPSEVALTMHRDLLSLLRAAAQTTDDEALAATCQRWARDPGAMKRLARAFSKAHNPAELSTCLDFWPVVVREHIEKQGKLGLIATCGLAVSIAAFIHHPQTEVAVFMVPDGSPRPDAPSPNLN